MLLIIFSSISIIVGIILILISLSLILSYPIDQNGNIKLLGIIRIKQLNSPSNSQNHIKIGNFEFTVTGSSIILLLVGTFLFVLPFFTTLNNVEKIIPIENLKNDIIRASDQYYYQTFEFGLKTSTIPPFIKFHANEKNQIYLTLKASSRLNNAKIRMIINNERVKLPNSQSGNLTFETGTMDPTVNKLNITKYVQSNIEHEIFDHLIRFEIIESLKDLLEKVNSKEQTIVFQKKDSIIILEVFMIVEEKI